jgi:hypothetical protein
MLDRLIQQRTDAPLYHPLPWVCGGIVAGVPAARAEPRIRVRRPSRPIVVVGLPAARTAQPIMSRIVVARRPHPVGPPRRPRKPILVLGLPGRAALSRVGRVIVR